MPDRRTHRVPPSGGPAQLRVRRDAVRLRRRGALLPGHRKPPHVGERRRGRRLLRDTRRGLNAHAGLPCPCGRPVARRLDTARAAAGRVSDRGVQRARPLPDRPRRARVLPPPWPNRVLVRKQRGEPQSRPGRLPDQALHEGLRRKALPVVRERPHRQARAARLGDRGPLRHHHARRDEAHHAQRVRPRRTHRRARGPPRQRGLLPAEHGRRLHHRLQPGAGAVVGQGAAPADGLPAPGDAGDAPEWVAAAGAGAGLGDCRRGPPGHLRRGGAPCPHGRHPPAASWHGAGAHPVGARGAGDA